MSDRFITAEEARDMLEGVTPGPWGTRQGDGWDYAKIIAPDDLPGTVEVATMEQEDSGDVDARLMAAAPDLAATVIAQAEQIKRLQAYIRQLESSRDYQRYIRNDSGLKAEDMEGADE